MDYNAIINLMKEMNKTDLTRLEIEEEEIKILMEKINNFSNMQDNEQSISLSRPLDKRTDKANESNKSNVNNNEEAVKKILSPMVGTFYTKPAPDKPPYVIIGDKVEKGQTICIIEAMKLMNEIECDYDGEIIEILVGNEEMVEFGQPLFIVG